MALGIFSCTPFTLFSLLTLLTTVSPKHSGYMHSQQRFCTIMNYYNNVAWVSETGMAFGNFHQMTILSEKASDDFLSQTRILPVEYIYLWHSTTGQFGILIVPQFSDFNFIMDLMNSKQTYRNQISNSYDFGHIT